MSFLPTKIDCLALSQKAKKYLRVLGYDEIITDGIKIDHDNTMDTNEALSNLWSFALDYDLNLVSKLDLKIFIQSIINSRSHYLKTYYPEYKMIFYLWYDNISGLLKFSLVSDITGKLPFECEVLQVNLDTVLKEFVNDKHRGSIPISECKMIEYEDEASGELPSVVYSLNVYSTVIPN